MTDIPRLTLIEIITQYGRIVIDDPSHVEGLLRDSCGEYKREIDSLMAASHQRIPLELRDASGDTSPAILIPSLTKRLLDNRPMDKDMACWAVETWAIALGFVVAPAAVKPTFEPQMLLIPAGEFIMGSTAQQLAPQMSQGALSPSRIMNEQPQHKVFLDTYAIGKYPITCREYQAFVQDSLYPAPQDWSGSQYPPGKAEHPVVYVSWEDAQAYCGWLSQKTGKRYRLPSEAEWEKAARGTDGRIYPWGNRFEAGRANSYEAKLKDTTPVGQFSPQGDSPYGCVDMAGNTWEWVNDWYDLNYYRSSPAKNPTGPTSGKCKVLRGGGWYYYIYYLRVAYRNTFDPVSRYDITGFRCALTPES